MQSGLTKNISSGGVLFTAEKEPDVGASIEYVITLGGPAEPHVNLRCMGKVLRANSSNSERHSLRYRRHLGALRIRAPRRIIARSRQPLPPNACHRPPFRVMVAKKRRNLMDLTLASPKAPTLEAALTRFHHAAIRHEPPPAAYIRTCPRASIPFCGARWPTAASPSSIPTRPKPSGDRAGPKRGGGDAHRQRQDAVLQPAGAEPAAAPIPARAPCTCFPTKALAEDQLHELQTAIDGMGSEIRAFTYDGDTPQDARKAIRQRANMVLTNPDMLHSGILPHHTRWAKLFENLRYIVIDELHYYRGVYGSHLANVLRRLRRICEFYGSKPQFICCSATIANPRELAEALTGMPFALVDRTARRAARNISSSTIRRW